MSKRNIPHYVCGVIPHHMLTRLAGQTDDPSDETGANARATLEHMRELATGQAVTSLIGRPAVEAAALPPRKRRHVYDARHRFRLPGKLVMDQHMRRSSDVEVREAYDGSGVTYEFFAKVFHRSSIDGKGMRLDSTVHYGTRFENALWNGRQMVYGDGDGRIFKRFTASVDVIAHELTHGLTQHAAALGYAGQTGALNEHLADAFGMMVKQYMLGQSAHESDWFIGAEIFGPDVQGDAVRSFAFPGTAYDDPVLGRDPQPSHMRDYVHTTDDNGGIHINSGILNHGFYLAAMALGGKTWEVLGKIWYRVLTERLTPEADFADFTHATVDIAGELFGNGGRVQSVLSEAWSDVGLPVHLSERAAGPVRVRGRRPRPLASTKQKRFSRKEKPSMSTNSKDLNPKQSSEATIAKSKRSVDRHVRALMQEMEHENTLVQDSPNGRLQRVLKIFRSLKPMFVVISSLPLIPATWRAAIAMLVQALDALAVVRPDLTADFKAGRDL